MVISNKPISHTIGVISGRTRHSLQIEVSVGRAWTGLNPESGWPGIKFLSPITWGSRKRRFERTLIDTKFPTVFGVFVPFVAAIIQTIAQSVHRNTDTVPTVSTFYLRWTTGTLNNRGWGAVLKLDIIDCKENWWCSNCWNINREKSVLE